MCEDKVPLCNCFDYDRKMPPWAERGHNIPFISGSYSWQKAWPSLKDGNRPNLVESASDFYLLEAMISGVVFKEPLNIAPYVPSVEDDKAFFKAFGIKSVQRQAKLIAERDEAIEIRRKVDPAFDVACILGEAHKKLETLVNALDPILLDYIVMVVGGELRYHNAISRHESGGRMEAWVGWKDVVEAVGPQALEDAAEMFMEFRSGLDFGGPGWADAAMVAYERMMGTLGPDEFTNKKLFIDRAWTLEHNNGTLFNKIDWPGGLDCMWEILDAHASNPPNLATLQDYSSSSVSSLLDEYSTACVRYFESKGLSVANPFQRVEVCSSCYSDPNRGHMLNCTSVYNGSIGTRWVALISVHHSLKGNYTIETYPVNAEGQLILKETDKVSFGTYGNADNIAKNVQLKNALNKEVPPSQHYLYLTVNNQSGLVAYSSHSPKKTYTVRDCLEKHCKVAGGIFMADKDGTIIETLGNKHD